MVTMIRPIPVILLLGMTLAGCSWPPFEVNRDLGPGIAQVKLAGEGEVSQAVTLTPERPRQNEAFEIRSVVRNTGSRPVTLTTAVCLLPLEGSLVVDEPLILCSAVSMAGELAPGDSITIVREAHTNSPPGTYRLTVRHLLEPAVSVPLDVTVLP